MLKTTAGCILSLALAACGPAVATDESPAEPHCDPWAEVCEVSLLPDWDARSVLDLELGSVSIEPTDEPAQELRDGHVRASLGRYLALQSELDDPLVCLLRDRYASLTDVPTDPSVCDCEALGGCWDHTALFGLLGTDGAEFEDAGLLLRTSGGDLYRARVLVADSSFEQSRLTIEYEGVM